jgi:2-polyprenyl-3-methyl-5-hydroxy-6-metoxy-1,4-benzoquinol methylase
MNDESVRELDAEALAQFARKGWEAGAGALQITRDLARRPLETLRILDLGCGEGVYAVEPGKADDRVTVAAVHGRRCGCPPAADGAGRSGGGPHTARGA